MREAVDRVNSQLSVTERVRQFAFADEAFTIENEEMTPSLKVRRYKLVERYGELDDATFVSARQENLETIHQHNVTAERFGLLGELRREIATDEHLMHHTSMREWLDAGGR